MPDKIMPHNVEAEQSVIGAMFLSKIALEKSLENLTSDLFYLDSHNKIFQTINDLVENGIPIDITTVTAKLKDKKWLKIIGDVEYLTEIINSVPSARNINEYIKIVDEKATLRRLIEESLAIANAGFDTSNNFNEVLDNAEKKIFNIAKTRKGTEFRTIQDVLSKTQQDLEKLSKNKGEITGTATGFYDIDKITSGLHSNELVIIASRPAMGKTAFALNIATNIAINNNQTVAIFNMEMGAEQLATRMLSSVGQIEGNKLKTGRLEHNDWKRINEAISRLGEAKMYIDDTPGMTISEIRAKCRRLASSDHGLGIIIIDYLQLIQGSALYSGNRQQEVSEISRSLKTLAMELSIPIIALSQLSRTADSRGKEDRRPMLSDLRESGAIEQDADIVAFLFREDYYDKEVAIDENTSKSEFIIAKHRNGPTTTIDLIFKRNTSTFISMVNQEANI
ncbi:MAG: replicative DNA helicase [Bacilli bacterium]